MEVGTVWGIFEINLPRVEALTLGANPVLKARPGQWEAWSVGA